MLADRFRELHGRTTEPGGTTRIAAVLKRFADDCRTGLARGDWSAGPIEQRRG